MRIKLRLYPRDLDLLALKQHPHFNFGAAIRQALWEYVTHGECSRIHVPHDNPEPVVVQNDQIDISLTKDMYEKVVEWIISIRPGMRNSAVKAVFRSAISNPALDAFYNDSNAIYPKQIAEIGRQDSDQAADECSKTNLEPRQNVSSPGMAAKEYQSDSHHDAHIQPDPQDETDVSELDLWELNFDNY